MHVLFFQNPDFFPHFLLRDYFQVLIPLRYVESISLVQKTGRTLFLAFHAVLSMVCGRWLRISYRYLIFHSFFFFFFFLMIEK